MAKKYLAVISVILLSSCGAPKASTADDVVNASTQNLTTPTETVSSNTHAAVGSSASEISDSSTTSSSTNVPAESSRYGYSSEDKAFIKSQNMSEDEYVAAEMTICRNGGECSEGAKQGEALLRH